jgi:hypothetical protein
MSAGGRGWFVNEAIKTHAGAHQVMRKDFPKNQTECSAGTPEADCTLGPPISENTG